MSLRSYAVLGVSLVGLIASGCSGLMGGGDTSSMRDVQSPLVKGIIKNKADSARIDPGKVANWLELAEIRESIGDIPGLLDMAARTNIGNHYKEIMDKIDFYLGRHEDYLELHPGVRQRMLDMAK